MHPVSPPAAGWHSQRRPVSEQTVLIIRSYDPAVLAAFDSEKKKQKNKTKKTLI